MRTILYCDVSAAARVLLGIPKSKRAEMCARMLGEADLADRFLRRKGQVHPRWGNGTLLDAARRREMQAEASFDDADYCACFQEVLRAICRRPRSMFL